MRRPITYLDFAVEFTPAGKAYEARVSFADGGSAPTVFHPPVGCEDLDGLLTDLEGLVRDLRRPHRNAGEDLDPLALGTALFEALFAGGVRDAYHQRLAVARREDRGVRLRLVLDPDDHVLAALPWELLYDPHRQRFLAHNPKTPVVRYMKRSAAVDPRLEPAERPLRVLVADASPRGAAHLDVAAERRRIQRALARRDVEVCFAEAVSYGGLQEALRDHDPHVFHFIGHGTFDDAAQEGAILLTSADGGSDRLTGPDLAVVLSGCDTLRLVVINACEGAVLPRSEGVDPFAGVASSLLLRTDLAAVVAMQLSITDRAAGSFGGAFYEALVQGAPVEAAVAEGRKAIYDGDRGKGTWEWATPVLYLRAEDSRIFHFEPKKEVAPEAFVARAQRFDDLIEDVTRRFVGRHFVFDKIDELITKNDRGYFLIEGDPGIGKTALMAKLAQDRGYPRHFNFRREDAYNSAEAFLANICCQLIADYRLPYAALPPEATRNSAFLKRLLGEISRDLGDGDRLVILVDALDEVLTGGSPATNVLHLPERLPRGVYFVLTDRRNQNRHLTVRSPYRLFELKAASDDNKRDVREHIDESSERPGIRAYLERHHLSEARFAEDLTRRSEYNFMYLYHVLREISDGAYRDVSLEEIPVGLVSYYEDHWRRMQEHCGEDWKRTQLPVLAALTLAKKPVSLMAVADLTGIDDHIRVMTVLLAWDAFLHRIPDPSGSERRKLYRLYHETFHEFIHEKDEVGAIDLSAARKKMDLAYDERFRRHAAEPPERSITQNVKADRGGRVSGVTQVITKA